MPPDLIIGLRHGEKPADAEHPQAPLGDAGPGLDQQGDVNPSSLTLRGWQRSGALAATRLCGLLAPAAAAEPVTVLVPRYKHTKRHRSHQTVLALALRLGTDVDDPCEAGSVDALHTRVLAGDGTVVVCWEHDALVELAARLSDTAPQAWPDGRFDVLWVFSRRSGGDGYDCEQRAQDLLPEDSR